MAVVGQGGRSRIVVQEDFVGFDPDYVWAAGGFQIGRFSVTSVNEGTIESTVDEPNGVLAITTDTGDDDNIALYLGPGRPADGTMSIEARVKSNSSTLGSWFIGFTETLAKDTPVMPAEFATATMTYNGTGGMIGAQWDSDGTTDDWRAVMGDGGAAKSDSANGIAAGDTMVADKYDVIRVNLFGNGGGEVYVNEKKVKQFTTGTLLTPTDLFHPVVMYENRSAAARLVEIDYIDVEMGRKWDE